MQLAAFPLRDLRNLRENIHMRVLKIYCTNETPMSPADLADDADKPQNYNNPKTKLATNCLYLRDNAACCIPLRNQRYLRENIHMRVLNLLAQRKPQCLPQISQITQTNHKTQSSNNYNNQPVFLCGIMQLAAFLCVICAICGRIFT